MQPYRLDSSPPRLNPPLLRWLVATLAAHCGIAATRLSAFGGADLAPVASNAAEDGRARNRRVELVPQ